MNKLVIPAILVATVMVAGIFAFIPVEQATTVHTTVVADLQGGGGLDHDDISDDIADTETAILLDLEEKIKLSEDSDGPTAVSTGGETSTITIRALDTGNPTTFNLKECYLEGTSDNAGGDDIQVTAIRIDGTSLYQGSNQGFPTPFGPTTDGNAGTSMVDLLSGLGFTNGLGATDTITMTVNMDSGEFVDQIQCIAFVQNSADLVVTIDDPSD